MIDDPLVKTEKEDRENDPKPEDLPFDFVMYPFQWKTDACSKETDEGRSDVSFGSVCLEIVFQALFCAYRIAGAAQQRSNPVSILYLRSATLLTHHFIGGNK